VKHAGFLFIFANMSVISGNLAEIKFLLLCTEKGHIVSKPIMDGCNYDFIVDRAGIVSRVQVKSTNCFAPQGNCYVVNINHGNKSEKRYSKSSVDEIAVYVFDYDAWYLIPVVGDNFTTYMRVAPNNPLSKGKYEKFRIK
jgi:hypothetical protein